MECVKLSTRFELERAKSGGPSRADKHRKAVFELYHNYAAISKKDQKIRWSDPKNIDKYQKCKTEFEQQSLRRDRLCAIYDAVSECYSPSTISNCNSLGSPLFWTRRSLQPNTLTTLIGSQDASNFYKIKYWTSRH
jgi:hypothetical protein